MAIAVTTATGATFADTSLTATLQAGTTFKYLFVFIRGVSPTFAPPSGWSQIGAVLAISGSEQGILMRSDAETSSVSETVGWGGGAVNGGYLTWNVTGSDLATTAEATGTPATGSGSTPDPPSVTVPWTSGEENAFVTFGSGNDGRRAWTGAPTDYAQLGAAASGAISGVNMGAAVRIVTLDSDDPGIFTTAGGGWDWATQTIVIRTEQVVGGITLAQALEQDTAQPLQVGVEVEGIVLATATENDVASPLDLSGAGSTTITLAESAEEMTAFPLQLLILPGAVGIALAQAAEEDTAQPLDVQSEVEGITLAAALEQDTAQPLDLSSVGATGIELAAAAEEDTAQPLDLAGSGTTGIELATATEQDVASPVDVVADAVRIVLAQAREEDTALPLDLSGAGVATLELATAVEGDTGQPLIVGIVVDEENPMTIQMCESRCCGSKCPRCCISQVAGVDSPDWWVWWRDSTGDLLELAGWTVTLRVGRRFRSAVVVKTSGISEFDGDDDNPNVIVEWDPGELDPVPAGRWLVQLSATSPDNEAKVQCKMDVAGEVLV